MKLYVGGQAWAIQHQRDDLEGERCWTAAHPCQAAPAEPARVRCLLDSGAFTDAPEDRLPLALALGRQLCWEAQARRAWGCPDWQVEALVSYDRLIDETWIAGARHK